MEEAIGSAHSPFCSGAYSVLVGLARMMLLYSVHKNRSYARWFSWSLSGASCPCIPGFGCDSSVRAGIRPLRGARQSIEMSCDAGPVD